MSTEYKPEDDDYDYRYTEYIPPSRSMTSKAVKKAYNRWQRDREVRGLTAIERRQIERRERQERSRLQAIQRDQQAEQARRTRELNRRTREAEARARRQQGLELVRAGERTIDEVAAPTSASQTRLGAFFIQSDAPTTKVKVNTTPDPIATVDPVVRKDTEQQEEADNILDETLKLSKNQSRLEPWEVESSLDEVLLTLKSSPEPNPWSDELIEPFLHDLL